MKINELNLYKGEYVRIEFLDKEHQPNAVAGVVKRAGHWLVQTFDDGKKNTTYAHPFGAQIKQDNGQLIWIMGESEVSTIERFEPPIR